MVRNITFSVDEKLIDWAVEEASKEGRSLDDAFRQWLERYSAKSREEAVRRFDELMARLSHVRVGRHLTREEMHER